MPSVNKLYSEFKPLGLEVLLIGMREDAAVVKRAVRERGYVARVLLDASGDTAGRVYGVWGTPTAYFVDRRGGLVGRVVGPREWDTPEGRSFLRALLEGEGGR